MTSKHSSLMCEESTCEWGVPQTIFPKAKEFRGKIQCCELPRRSDVDALLANMNLSPGDKNKIKSMCDQCALLG